MENNKTYYAAEQDGKRWKITCAIKMPAGSDMSKAEGMLDALGVKATVLNNKEATKAIADMVADDVYSAPLYEYDAQAYWTHKRDVCSSAFILELVKGEAAKEGVML